MSFPVILFLIVAATTTFSALGVVLSRSVVRSAVWLLGALIGIAVCYFLLGAEFLGAAQLIVYVGGTLVLMVFGVMITNQGPFAGIHTKPVEWILGGSVASLLFAFLVTFSLRAAQPSPVSNVDTLPSAGPIGAAFLGVPDERGTAFLLPFEIVSIHLLVVLVAAAYLARAKRRPAAKVESHG